MIEGKSKSFSHVSRMTHSRIANRESRIIDYIYLPLQPRVMKKHSGMRPHDVCILLKIASKGEDHWYMKDIAQELRISPSEVSESINRSVIAGLIGNDKKTLRKLALLDFLKFGIKYVFPQRPGSITRGVATSISAPPLNSEFLSDEQFVWPYAKGSLRGQAIEPLHPRIPEACVNDSEFHQLMALTDALRTGRVREQNLAFEILKERIEHAQKPKNQSPGS